MLEFFRGWRRKTGLALLAMTLLWAGIWICSLVNHDDVIIATTNQHHHLMSERGIITWMRLVDWRSQRPYFHSHRRPIFEFADTNRYLRRWRFLEFECAIGFLQNGSKFVRYAIPYWSIVLPMTLLSALLLLRKPLPAKSVMEPRVSPDLGSEASGPASCGRQTDPTEL